MVDVLLVGVVLVAVAASLFVGYLVGRALTTRTKEFEFLGREKEARRDSTERSRTVLTGQFMEKLAPHFPDFPHDPTEVRFIGTPIDYVVFEGLSAGTVQEVVFLEVKTGKSRLKSGQRSVRDAIEAGRVRWEEYRPPEG